MQNTKSLFTSIAILILLSCSPSDESVESRNQRLQLMRENNRLNHETEKAIQSIEQERSINQSKTEILKMHTKKVNQILTYLNEITREQFDIEQLSNIESKNPDYVNIHNEIINRIDRINRKIIETQFDLENAYRENDQLYNILDAKDREALMLHDTINLLRDSLHQKTLEIKRLTQIINEKTEENIKLKSQNNAIKLEVVKLEKTIRQIEQNMDCYVLVASRDEIIRLKKQDFLKGNLTFKIPFRPNMEYSIDALLNRTDFQKCNCNHMAHKVHTRSKPKVISKHKSHEELYFFQKKSRSAYHLKIKDTTTFWSDARWLIIQKD